MIVDKYSVKGEKIGQVELSDKVFSDKINDVVVYEYIKAANANLRQGTHKTKERAEVSGGGVKPWRQKGTGRARSGSNRSPIWVGGGTVFGPRVRSYRIELPKKVKKKAFRSILSIKAQQGDIVVVEDFNVDSGKTKEMNSVLKKLNVERGIFVSSGDDTMIKRSIKNIADVKYNNASRLSGRDVFYSKKVLLTESAVNAINQNFA
ncbi:MAG: 50S ribosomal protein L4 [Spirochaetes bacterium]|nr:50S ribosomal protein L4 [Spirochaetota bacterium]MBN2769123.1 50S ribosomal protein L4 [Spirochaetota bacterium]